MISSLIIGYINKMAKKKVLVYIRYMQSHKMYKEHLWRIFNLPVEFSHGSLPDQLQNVERSRELWFFSSDKIVCMKKR